MSFPTPTLHMVCGKIGAGKSTLTARLGNRERTVVISEDAWLGTLFADRMASIPDYLRCASTLRRVIGPHVEALLNAGVSVVLDFPANTVETRAWMRNILDRTGAAHRLHVLEVPDEVCLARLRARNARGDHPFAVTDDQFRQITGHFAPPTPEEGFDIEVHRDTP